MYSLFERKLMLRYRQNENTNAFKPLTKGELYERFAPHNPLGQRDP